MEGRHGSEGGGAGLPPLLWRLGTAPWEPGAGRRGRWAALGRVVWNAHQSFLPGMLPEPVECEYERVSITKGQGFSATRDVIYKIRECVWGGGMVGGGERRNYPILKLSQLLSDY